MHKHTNTNLRSEMNASTFTTTQQCTGYQFARSDVQPQVNVLGGVLTYLHSGALLHKEKGVADVCKYYRYDGALRQVQARFTHCWRVSQVSHTHPELI